MHARIHPSEVLFSSNADGAQRCRDIYMWNEQDAWWEGFQILKLFTAALRHRHDEEGDWRLLDAAY